MLKSLNSTGSQKRIVLTGGGTAGHVMVNLALWPHLIEDGWQPIYIGSKKGIEKELISGKMPYFGIESGKLRRYFDAKNFTDIFRVLVGIVQAFYYLQKIQPRIIFSKGGFVSVPVVIAGWLGRIPIVAHEADFTPGLANRLSQRFVKHFAVAFPETQKFLPPGLSTVTGIPIREEILKGSREKGRALTGFSQEKPVLIIMGGSSGSQSVNSFVRARLESLVEHFQIVHLCGRGNLTDKIPATGYLQFEYLNEELSDILAIADIAISRAGANSLFELLHLQIPHLLIPLPLGASRGDQIDNAKSFQSAGLSLVLLEKDFHKTDLLKSLLDILKDSDHFKAKMRQSPLQSSSGALLKIIYQYANPNSKN